MSLLCAPIQAVSNVFFVWNCFCLCSLSLQMLNRHVIAVLLMHRVVLAQLYYYSFWALNDCLFPFHHHHLGYYKFDIFIFYRKSYAIQDFFFRKMCECVGENCEYLYQENNNIIMKCELSQVHVYHPQHPTWFIFLSSLIFSFHMKNRMKFITLIMLC